jgi:uncharacterized protein (DUF305 family)
MRAIMTTTETAPIVPAPPATAPPGIDAPDDIEPGFWTRWFGPLTPWRIVALIVAFTFLGGAAGWVVRDRQEAWGHNTVDVGFAQDMMAHHDQAIEMALTVLSDDTVPREIRSEAQEVVIFQRDEIGLLNDALARWDKPTVGNGTAMGWMGRPVPANQMEGLATDAQMARLSKARGRAAGALFLAMMSRHHLGGIDMARYEAKHGKDHIMKALADSMARTQSQEIVLYSQTRHRLGLPVPSGYTDPP